MIVAIGSNDTLASPGAQLDFYQSVLNKMGRSKVDSFARLYVLPQTGHGLTGTNYTTDGEGNKLEARPIPNTFDRAALLTAWVENGVAPGKSLNRDITALQLNVDELLRGCTGSSECVHQPRRASGRKI